jgi:hypothetical protein
VRAHLATQYPFAGHAVDDQAAALAPLAGDRRCNGGLDALMVRTIER